MNAHPGEVALPHDEQAEAGLLAIILVDASGYSRVADRIKPEYFYLNAHQQIFAAMADLSAKGRSIGPITVRTYFDAEAQVGEMGMTPYLMRLHRDATSIINAQDYADIIRDCWAKREILRTAADATELVRSAMIGGADACITTVSDQLSLIRAAVTSDSIPMDLVAAAETANRTMDGVGGEHEKGIPLPFRGLAEVFQDDLMPGQLYGLLAASGEGKTSLILHIMRYAAEKGHPCALMSFDQDGRKCINQMASQALRIEEWRVRKNALSDAQRTQLKEVRAKISALPLTVIQCPDANINAVLSRATAFVDYQKRKTIKCPLVIIDHIMAITDHDPRADAGSKAQHKNRAFRNWAVRHGSAALMVNQRNSSGMRETDRWLPRPTIRDLTGGEAARQDYDTIIGMFRPEWWRDEALKRVPDDASSQRSKIDDLYGGDSCTGKLEISLIKARHGNPRTKRTLKFEGVYTRVSDPDDEQPSLLEGGMPF